MQRKNPAFCPRKRKILFCPISGFMYSPFSPLSSLPSLKSTPELFTFFLPLLTPIFTLACYNINQKAGEVEQSGPVVPR